MQKHLKTISSISTSILLSLFPMSAAVFVFFTSQIAQHSIAVDAVEVPIGLGLGSILAIPGWDIRRRSGRPLADVSENLRDDAISRSEEGEEETENAEKEGSDILAIGPNNGGAEESAADALPDFMMSPFLEKAFSMSPSSAPSANSIDSGEMSSTPWTTFLTFRRPTTTPQPPRIHEADLMLENRLPSMPARKYLNVPEISMPNENNNDKPKNQTSSSSSSSSSPSSNAPFAPTMVSVQKKQEQRHCSWQMLNTFLLIWSILSTIHWLWLCSSKLFGFMHQMEVNNNGKGKKNNAGGGGTANAPAIRQHRMRQLMMGRRQPQHQKQQQQAQKAKLCKPKIPPPLPPPPLNVNPLPPIIVRKNSSTEAATSSSAVSSGDEKRIINSDNSNDSNNSSNKNIKQKQLHRTVISIGGGEPSSESIRQRKRRAAANLLAAGRRKPSNLAQTAVGNNGQCEDEQQFYCAKNVIPGKRKQQTPAALKRKRNRQLQQRQQQQKSPLIMF